MKTEGWTGPRFLSTHRPSPHRLAAVLCGGSGSRGAAGRRYGGALAVGPVTDRRLRPVAAPWRPRGAGRGRCCPALAPLASLGGSIGAAGDKLAPF